ncbi:MAG: hypothetical protein KKE50_02190 [Nanoarchaeota archaeon]|nr:hypothetical protein [Nanoarchaeota archaeon]
MAETILDMEREAELSSASSQLQTVATGLQKLIDGKDLEDREREELNRFGNLFGQVDWMSGHYRRKEHPELCVIATRLRPVFYRACVKSTVPFDRDYSEKIYKTLKSAGRELALSPQELQQAQIVFHAMSEEISSSLQAAQMISDPD